MADVNIENLKSKFPEIVKSFQECKLVSVDLEFSALHPLEEHTPSLFDTPEQRYNKLRKNVKHIIPLQIGFTAFSYDANRYCYIGKMYNFYVQPASFQCIEKSFYFRSDAINFLKMYNFDFNKFAYLGVPYINKVQEKKLRQKFVEKEISETEISCKRELENIINNFSEIIGKWYMTANFGDFLDVPELSEIIKHNYELQYFVHKHFRSRFRNLWTIIENTEFTVKKLTDNEIKQLETTHNLQEELFDNLLGFTKIFRLLTTLQKPVIGHNLLYDLLLMLNSFETSLPYSYTQFKKITLNLFPIIFDTKVISRELRTAVPDEKRWTDTGLDSIFNYFKNGTGRHLAPNSPAIEIENGEEFFGKFHNAAWDSFCAGYVFLRLAHLNLSQKFPVSKQFVSNELIGGLMHLKNKVNVIRGSVSLINLDGVDPSSTRPPFLVVESVKNKPVDIPQVTSLLSSYGFVEVKKLSYQTKRVLVAVDNFGNARRILSNFKSNTDFNVKQYSVLKHSPFVRAFLFTGVTFSGAILLWLTHSAVKR